MQQRFSQRQKHLFSDFISPILFGLLILPSFSPSSSFVLSTFFLSCCASPSLPLPCLSSSSLHSTPLLLIPSSLSISSHLLHIIFFFLFLTFSSSCLLHLLLPLVPPPPLLNLLFLSNYSTSFLFSSSSPSLLLSCPSTSSSPLLFPPPVGSFFMHVISQMSHLSSMSLSVEDLWVLDFIFSAYLPRRLFSFFFTDVGHLTVWHRFQISAAGTLIHYSSVPSRAAIGCRDRRKYVSTTC